MNPRLLKAQLERLIGKRVRYAGSSKPDPSLTVGMEGTVELVDDQPALAVKWDSGAFLSLLPGVDRWDVVVEGVAHVTPGPAIVEEMHLTYLDRLRESAVTNMFGAAPYLQRQFRLTEDEAHDVVFYWMKTFSERHPRQGADS